MGQTCWAGQAYSPTWGTELHLAAEERGPQPTTPHAGEVVPLHLELGFHFNKAEASRAREPVFSGQVPDGKKALSVPGLSYPSS